MASDEGPEPPITRPTHLEPVETGDGSTTLYDSDRDVHFSSLHGARTESRHIFIEGTGLARRRGTWRVLELGFGAGMNAHETIQTYLDTDRVDHLDYRAVDYAPVRPADVPLPDDPPGRLVRRVLDQIETAPARRSTAVSSDAGAELRLYARPWSDLELEGFRAEALFFDPFGPKSEPESWSVTCFRVAYRHLADGGVLGTYSAASDVKRAMFRAGLVAATAPGPGPKREITFAARSRSALEKLDDVELLDRERYHDSSHE